ncbi:MAG: molybdopterin-dependent oxidoreductase, partial [Planctomycetota bacterium]
LDKEFLFQQRVWFLTKTPSVDGLTASGDNIFVEHNDGKVHRIKPRTNMDVNTWWITDEVRYSWKHVHSESRLRLPRVKGAPAADAARAGAEWKIALAAAQGVLAAAWARQQRLGLMVSPMLTCEDAFALASWMLALDPKAELAVGPVPFRGEDRTFKGGFTMYAEKAPNARGVRRVLEALSARRGGGAVHDSAAFSAALRAKQVGAAVITGNYPSDWVTPEFRDACMGTTIVLVDTLENALCNLAEVVLPGAMWTEKDGSFENAKHRLQAFGRAIAPVDFARAEFQVGADLESIAAGRALRPVDAGTIRAAMSAVPGLERFGSEVHVPDLSFQQSADMQFAEL